MAISLIILLLLVFFAGFTLTTLIGLAFSSTHSRLAPLSEDPQNIRSQITFKPLPRFYDHATPARMPYRHAMAMALFDRMEQRGVSIDKISNVGDAQRIRLQFDGEIWDVTLGLYKSRPEQWLIKVDQIVKRGQRSAPHDIAASRALLSMLKTILEGMDVSTVRWHQRQYWDAGKVDVWSHKPF